MSQAYLQFKAVQQQLTLRTQKAQAKEKPVHHSGTTLTTVDALQRNVLSIEQLDAIEQIQGAIRTMGQLQEAINQLATLNRLELRRIMIPQAGMLWHDIEDLLWSHNSAAAKLRNGGIALQGNQVLIETCAEGVMAA